jgi:hypothetical protein
MIENEPCPKEAVHPLVDRDIFLKIKNKKDFFFLVFSFYLFFFKKYNFSIFSIFF